MYRQGLFTVLAVLAIMCSPVSANVDSFFDVFTEVSFGPPYPAVDSIGLNIGHESGPAGPIITDAVLTAGLEGVSPLDLPVEIFAHGEGSSSQYDPDWWVESFFDVFCEPPDPEPIPPDSFFDVFFDLDLPSGAGSPLLSQVPDVFHIDSFFDITFQIELPDGGLHDLILHGQTAPGVSFADVRVENVFAVDSFFDVFFELSIPDPLAVPPEPVMVMKMTGLYTPEPATLGLLALGGFAMVCRKRQ